MSRELLPKTGRPLLIIDRVLVDRYGNQRWTFVLRGTIVQVFPGGDALMSFQASNSFRKGVINTQGAIRFSDYDIRQSHRQARRPFPRQR
jgi:hypothetical protein